MRTFYPIISVINNTVWIFLSSLRSKRFRGVREQGKSEKRDFRCFDRAKTGARTKNRKEGRGRGRGRKETVVSSFPSPTPLFRFLASRTIFRAGKHRKSRSSVFLCSQTPRKCLLRRLFCQTNVRFIRISAAGR